MSAIPLTERVKEIFHAFFLQPDSAGLRRVFHYFHQDCILSGLEDSQMCVGLDAIEELLLQKKQEKVHLSFRFTNAQYHQRFLQDQVVRYLEICIFWEMIQLPPPLCIRTI